MSFTYHGRGIILVGDKTTHGGEVITGAETATWHDIPIACIGDKVTCPRCGGEQTIVQGAETATWMGRNIATHGDKVSCGATLISRFDESLTIYEQDSATSSSTQNYDERFQIVDEDTGEPFANSPYYVETKSGAIYFGETDKKIDYSRFDPIRRFSSGRSRQGGISQNICPGGF
jgi:uncharacterized Zn-binding protein involved in type VI secretion